jgi:hypothetical protein
LSDKEKREKVTSTGGGIITFDEAMARGIEAHNFFSDISLRTITPVKSGEGNDDRSTDKKIIIQSIFSVGGDTTTATNKFKAGSNLEENNVSSFEYQSQPRKLMTLTTISTTQNRRRTSGRTTTTGRLEYGRF